MAYRSLDISGISAKHLKDVNSFSKSKMDVYVDVSISGDDYGSKNKKQEARTHVDLHGGSTPTWNFPVTFTVDESLAKQNGLTLVFKIKRHFFFCDKDVGEVMVPIKELLDSPGDEKTIRFGSYQISKPSGKPKGELSFSYKFGDVRPVAATSASQIPAAGKGKTDEEVIDYAAGSSSATDGAAALDPHPPPTAGYPYPPPPQAGATPYGAYPPPPPYGAYLAPPPYSAYLPPPPYGAYPPPPPAAPYGAYPPSPYGAYPLLPLAAAYGAYPPPPYGAYPPPPLQPGYNYPPPPPGYGYPPVQNPPKMSGGEMGMGLGAAVLG